MIGRFELSGLFSFVEGEVAFSYKQSEFVHYLQFRQSYSPSQTITVKDKKQTDCNTAVMITNQTA